MSDQTVSMLVGASIVIVIRFLDWVFPKGYAWKKAQLWSVRLSDEQQRIKDVKDIKDIHDVADQDVKDIHDVADQNIKEIHDAADQRIINNEKNLDESI